MIVFRCPCCRTAFDATDDLAGELWICLRCGQTQQIPRPQREQLQALLTARPFVPFRIHLLDRSYCDVVHPELCVLAGERFSLFTEGELVTSTGQVCTQQRAVHFPTHFIARLEPLDRRHG